MTRSVRKSLTERCPFCFEEGAWSGYGEGAVYSVPMGHTIEYLDEGRTIQFDSCPRNRRERANEDGTP